MRFAQLERIPRLDRLRLPGRSAAHDGFLWAATAPSRRRMARSGSEGRQDAAAMPARKGFRRSRAAPIKERGAVALNPQAVAPTRSAVAHRVPATEQTRCSPSARGRSEIRFEPRQPAVSSRLSARAKSSSSRARLRS